ncbi:hypothetical protein BGZ73_001934, partial [Actinomortierella ambigua]
TPLQHIDIIALQELTTKHISHPLSEASRNEWAKEWGSSPDNLTFIHSEHCALIINQRYNKLTFSNPQSFVDGRVLSAEVICDGDAHNTFRITNVYAPVNADPKHHMSPQVFARQFPADEIDDLDHHILLGDLNAVRDPDRDRSHGSFPPAWKWKEYEPVFDRLSLTDVAPSPPQRPDGTHLTQHFTHHFKKEGYASRTRIDYILATRRTVPLMSGYLVQEVTAISSDHFLVSAKINFADPSNPPKIRAAPSLDSRILYEKDFRAKIKEAILHHTTKRKDQPHLYPTP